MRSYRRGRSGNGSGKSPRIATGLPLLLVVLVLLPSEVLGVPTFARRYRTSCATCHQAYPRLNSVGEAFRLNGFRFVDDEAYRKVQPVELGDEAYKKLWPKALWPTDIPSTSPLSFVARMMTENDLDGSRQHRVTALIPEEVELVWAGNIGDDIAFYGDVIYIQKDFLNGTETNSWATVKSWVQFQDLVGDNKLNLRVGSVGTQSVGLFNARDANTFRTHPYLYTSWEMPTPDTAAAGLQSFKGNHFSLTSYTGVEVNGFGRRWLYHAGLVTGDMPAPIGGPPASAISFWGAGEGGLEDVYGLVAFKFGGMPWDRSGEEQPATLAAGAEFWRDDSTTVSLFGYRGSAKVRATLLDGSADETDDEFWRVGVGVQHMYRDLTLGAVWTEGDNERPFGILSPDSVRSRAWHVEALYQPYPWLIPFILYESLDLEVPPGIPFRADPNPGERASAPGPAPGQDIARTVFGAKVMLRPNAWVIGETALYNKGAQNQEGFDGTLMLLFSLSF